MGRLGKSESARRWVAGSLALVTPFVSMLRYYDYPLWRAENLAFAALLAGLGLPLGWALGARSRLRRAAAGGLTLAIFAEYQFHHSLPELWSVVIVFPLATALGWLLYEQLATVLAAVLTAFLLSTLLLPVDTVSGFELGSGLPVQGNSDRPIALHLVLDEQVGIESVPLEIEGAAELARELRSFFVDRGFRVYPGAFSSFYNTRNSLAHIANLADRFTEGLSERAEPPFEWVVSQHRYFEHMASLGYRTRVTQSDYLNFCAGEGTRPADCRTYRAWSLAFVAAEPWPAYAKWKMFVRLYPMQSRAYDLVRKGYALLRRAVAGVGLPLPEWSWKLLRAPSVETLAEMSRLEAQAEGAKRGDLIFAHLLMPHSPYAYDRNCTLNPPSQWQDHKDRTLPSTHSNDVESRRERYRAHFEQVRCTLKRLDQILRALARNPHAKDAVVVIHGDHGARIGLKDALMKNREKLVPSDYVDAFGTLFAVRASGIERGSAPGILSVQSLLRALVEGDFQQPPEDMLQGYEPTIYYSAFRKRVVGSGPMIGFSPASESRR